jgi:threonylcarbamoyladenosine tRNA methylthiotransferase MtaB
MALGVYLESLGCKLNQCEIDNLAEQFTRAGYVIVSRPEDADLCVVNTCAVTQTATRKSRHLFRSLHRANPRARLVATGCSTGLQENGLRADLVVTNDRKQDLVSAVESARQGWGLCAEGSDAQGRTAAALLPRRRTRPFVKIQDGCDNACTYCIVRVLRGPHRSTPRHEILTQIANLVRLGYQEVVLTGVHVGAYGRDIGDDLIGLVRAILQGSALPRLRLSSIEPWDLAVPEFFELWEDPRLCRHLHLPLQSGCDETLARMNRHYTAAQFAELVREARAAIPGLAVTTDVIVGFPGETDGEFERSAAFIKQMAFARAHVFPYSERPGTPAATMPGSVDPTVRRARARQVGTIARLASRAFREQFLGCVLPVLWETRTKDGRWSGLTDHYVRVFVESDEDLSNSLCLTRLDAPDPNGLHGTLIEART